MDEENTEKIKPVKEGQIIIVKAEHEGTQGDAITKIQNFVIIIKRGIEGKTYQIIIKKVYATYAFAKIIKEIKQEEKTDEEEDNAI